MNQYYLVIGIFVAVCVGAVGYKIFNPKESFIDKKVIDHDEFLVHNSQSQHFTQGPNTQFEGQTMNEARLQFNLAIADNPNLQPCGTEATQEIPLTYDIRKDEERSQCVQPAKQSGNCTANHVLTSVSAVEDRLCIESEDSKLFNFSSQDVISCDDKNFYCNGGYVTNALNYGVEHGYVSESSAPWTGENVTCPAEPNPEREANEHTKILGYCALQGPQEIKQEIIESGPVIAPMSAYTDYLTYEDGLYFPDQGSFKFQGQHVVKIVGWGADMNGDYWIV